MDDKVLNLKKEKILASIDNDYFYGIDFERGIITGIKRINGYNKEIMDVYNNSVNEYEKLYFSTLLQKLKIERIHLGDEIKKANTENEIYACVTNFLKSNGKYFSTFTNDMLKRINLSINDEDCANIFARMGSVTDILSSIYFLCIDKAKELVEDNNYTREKRFIKALLDRYLSLIEAYLPSDSREYEVAKGQYHELLKSASSIKIEEFIDIFLKAVYELQKDIENINNKDKKVSSI